MGYETKKRYASPPYDDKKCVDSMEAKLQQESPVLPCKSTQYKTATARPSWAEEFRFHVTLKAPTAMIEDSDQIPVAYLNKGQACSISIVDTAPLVPRPSGSRYRTLIRISFEDEQQRQRPAACWQLWNAGHGTNEAQQRGGKLQAVEYVDAKQPAESDDERTRVDLDTASFDGFSVCWTPGMNGPPECNLKVRFNFLSTDFSHSKGVQGLPVRLCAKTETAATGPLSAGVEFSEVAFCKVRLFRDHGAERKLLNDITHVERTIDKLKHQIARAETDFKDCCKKNLTKTTVKSQPSQRSSKVQKHKKTCSISSASSAGGRLQIKEDLYLKLQTMQDMFTSRQPVSILYLRGSEQDDPDLYPVALTGEPLDLTKVGSGGSAIWQQRSSDRSFILDASLLLSPSPSSMSVPSQELSWIYASAALGPRSNFRSLATTGVQASNGRQVASAPDQSTEVLLPDAGELLRGRIKVLGVNPASKPPVERLVMPVACFYVVQRNLNQPQQQDYYQAIYLMQRTLKDLTHEIAAKWNLEPTKMIRILLVLERGLQVEIDDDVVRELKEGQDFRMEILEIGTAAVFPVTPKRGRSFNSVVDGDYGSEILSVGNSGGYELRLML